MCIKGLELRNFTVFKEADFRFSPGLNILLGGNSTGKTAVMKLLFAVLRATQKHGNSGDSVSMVHAKLANVFGHRHPDNRLFLSNFAEERASSRVELSMSEGTISFSMARKFAATLSQNENIQNLPDTVFIPSSELLSTYQGFIAAYDKRELAYDETFYDLCVALSAGNLKGEYAKEAEEILTPLLKVWPGEVSLENGAFYVTIEGDGKYSAHQLSEGYRKLATIVQLIRNGAITKGSVLFWDEPASNLNPKMVQPLAKLLMGLARAGVQVFISTHDYLLSNELSMHAEYATKDAENAEMQFFGLYRERPGKPALFDSGKTLNDLDNNLIQEEFAAHYDRNSELFFNSDKQSK